MQYRLRDGVTARYYSDGRDILGFYRPLHEAVLEIMAERHPDREQEIKNLRGMTCMIINEATAGEQDMKLPELLEAHRKAMVTIAQDLVHEYTMMLAGAYTWRYVMGKREPFEDRLGPEVLEKSFSGVYVLSVLPDDLAAEVRKHLKTYNLLPAVLFDNVPPAVAEEAKDEEDA
jgi:hypothetical protein